MSTIEAIQKNEPQEEFVPSFLNPEQDDMYPYYSHCNGLILQNIYIPEEILVHILSFVDPKQLLTISLVCPQWNKIIKSRRVWSIIYQRRYKRKSRDLPWFLYYCLFTTNYFTNMLDIDSENKIVERFKFIIDNIIEKPATSEYVSKDILNYHNNIGDTCLLLIKTHLKPQMRTTYCFRPEKCYTEQWFIKVRSKLMLHIINKYKPHLYFKGCGAVFRIQCGFIANEDFNGAITDEFLALGIMRQITMQKEAYDDDFTIIEYPNQIIEGLMIENKYLEIAAGGTLDGSVARFQFDSIKSIEYSAPTSPTINLYYKFIDYSKQY